MDEEPKLGAVTVTKLTVEQDREQQSGGVTTIARACAEIDERAERTTDLYFELDEAHRRIGDLEDELGRSEDRRFLL